MAGGKLTPRQKMINLMYLVFIAMLALNMSKEVLTAFGNFNDKFSESNKLTEQSNATLLSALDTKATDEPAKYAEPSRKAKEVAKISKDFVAFLETVKAEVTEGIEPDETGKLPFESMDKSTIDEKWFAGDGYSPRETEIVSKIDKYVADVKKVLGNDVKYIPFIKEIEKKFSTADITNREGVKQKFLDYKTKGFPAVSTLTFITAMQNDVKNTEAGAYNLFLGNALQSAASMKNFQAIVVLDKNAYFAGEQVTGKVVLGRYDANTVPTSFKGPGKIENGQAVISMTAGGIGEQNISGEFGFLEDGKEIPLKFEGKYVVVPRPNQAIISADKMNVVYRGVPNPISISVPGIASNKVNASAPGMSKVGDGKFMLKPGSGSEVKINVNATMPDGKSMSSSQVFRIKGLPAPTGKVGGSEKNKGPKSNLEVCSITAVMEDFDFPVTVNVTQFNVKVPGQPTIVVSGNRMDTRARSAIAKAQKGDVVVISEIKASFTGIDQMAKKVSICTYEIQ
ncbi:type IX secretion system motor protein PorM/GldM [Flavobacterium cheniae]|uniref:Protein involved in gliding motility GldM n=1 Tax=Flavobacterium cheniae TaxID=295428 RepID=A0A562KB24_9FLAO|nr:gliding motility protein GldM [Flavobacterium cheniae]TDR24022.1 protein involved in gliding motility GldM [Flavobacterium cheniae]TWH92586.1 protein involved in gliding motility GldM [Flavobacterium cheniae]